MSANVARDLGLAVLGGGMIGLAAGLFMLVNGRILGISGISGNLVGRWPSVWTENVLVLAGLILGAGLFAAMFGPPELSMPPLYRLAVAGLLVGFGSRLGNGCTSGHAVCGLARLSPRSMVATGLFMVTAALTVAITKAVLP